MILIILVVVVIEVVVVVQHLPGYDHTMTIKGRLLSIRRFQAKNCNFFSVTRVTGPRLQ